MSYYVRQIVSGAAPSVSDIAAGVSASGAKITFGEIDADGISTLFAGDTPIGEIEVNTRGSELFDEEVAEFMEKLAAVSGDTKAVEDAFDTATCIVAIQVLFQGRAIEDVMADMMPLMTWLQEHCPGLTQADGDGFYAGQDLILEM